MPLAISCMFVYYLVSAVIWDSIILHGFFVSFLLWNKQKTYIMTPGSKYLSAFSMTKAYKFSKQYLSSSEFPTMNVPIYIF